jgi:hypothetical protein
MSKEKLTGIFLEAVLNGIPGSQVFWLASVHKFGQAEARKVICDGQELRRITS